MTGDTYDRCDERRLGTRRRLRSIRGDFVVFGRVTVTALGSGALHHAFGWDAINLVMAPFIAVAFVMSFWPNRRTGRGSRAAQ